MFIITTPRPSLFSHEGIPHVSFPQYTRAQALDIIGQQTLPIQDTDSLKDSTDVDTDSPWLWQRFIAAVYDSIGQATARDIPTLRSICERLWRPFVRPIVDGHYGAREFSKLMVRNRPLFQSDSPLIDTIVPGSVSPTAALAQEAMHLPYHTTNLLVASYLASHNPPRTDIQMLSKSASANKRRRKRAAIATPKKNAVAAKSAQYRRLLGPQAFTLERLFAIYHAVIAGDRYRGGEAEVMAQFATLVGLRLVLRAGMGGISGGMGEALAGSGKWRCAVGWDFIRRVARSNQVHLEDLLVG